MVVSLALCCWCEKCRTAELEWALACALAPCNAACVEALLHCP